MWVYSQLATKSCYKKALSAHMTRINPYLQKRGFSLSFRLSIPHDLRPIFGMHEITKALPHQSSAISSPLALQYAASYKKLFSELRSRIAKGGPLRQMDIDKLMMATRAKKKELQLETQFEEKLEEQLAIKDAVIARNQKQNELEIAKLQGKLEAYEKIIHESPLKSSPSHPTAPPSAPISSAIPPDYPTLGELIDAYLKSYAETKYTEMAKVHNLVLPAFASFIGRDKSINLLKQNDLNRFFEMMQKLPPRWKDIANKSGKKIDQIANENTGNTIGLKTFEDKYIASVRAFLKDSKLRWQDEGFPTTLTVEGIRYNGKDEGGEKKQRSFKLEELKRLFEGEEIRGLASNPDEDHKLWLVAIGLYTGARINEICQLNPQTDICLDEDSQIWYFNFTDKIETDLDKKNSEITKSIKNQASKRKVPIHSKLIELGFLKYHARLKEQGETLIFPSWKPYEGRASALAIKWFSRFLDNIGLRDETKGENLSGFHAFRHTLYYTARNSTPKIENISYIAGHATTKESQDARGYGGTLSLANKQAMLEQIKYDIDFTEIKKLHNPEGK